MCPLRLGIEDGDVINIFGTQMRSFFVVSNQHNENDLLLLCSPRTVRGVGPFNLPLGNGYQYHVRTSRSIPRPFDMY
jgi:hypothetical protein